MKPRKARKITLHKDATGRIFQSEAETIYRDTNDNITQVKIVSHIRCPNCQRIATAEDINMNCPLCIVCCSHCHKERLELAKFHHSLQIDREKLSLEMAKHQLEYLKQSDNDDFDLSQLPFQIIRKLLQ